MLNWISGSKTIKKNSVLDHLKPNYHQSAVQILKERAAEKSESPQINEAEKLAATITAPSSSETSILTHFQQLNLRQREQLLKKFQLAHFIVQNNLAITKYENFANFEKEFHQVDLGVGFLNATNCREIVIFLSNSTIKGNVVKPLNEKKKKTELFCLLCDGSSSATTNNEKELYLTKTCKNGKPRFDVLSLQQPYDTSASGLHLSLKDSVRRTNFSFERRERMVGLGPDGTNTNEYLYELEKKRLEII